MIELKELKKAENVAFVNFGITNTVAGLLAMREHFEIRGTVKQKFSLLWKHARQIMNHVDREGERLHTQKMRDYKKYAQELKVSLSEQVLDAEARAALEKKMANIETKLKYVPLSEGYDEFSEHLTTFLELYLRAAKVDKQEKLLKALEVQGGLWGL